MLKVLLKSLKKKTSKEITSYPLKAEGEILCSLCALPIPSYTPDYFCGEQMNPAFHSFKRIDDVNDPFSSFPSTPPPSLVSHWLQPPHNNPPQNPSSIVTLTAHCVRLPNPGDKFISIEEALHIMREEMELRRAEMRGWLSQLLAPLSKLKLEED